MGWWPSTGCRCRRPPAPSTASSARTARARPPSSTPAPASSLVPRGTSDWGRHDLGRLSTPARATRGLGRTFQRMELFDSMTVMENVALGPEAHMAAGSPWRQLACGRRQRREINERARHAARRCGIETLAHRRAGDLSTGQRRLVELPASWPPPSVSSCSTSPPRVSTWPRRSASGPSSVTTWPRPVSASCWSSTTWHWSPPSAALIYVLDFGRLIFAGTTADALGSDVVRAAYLGSDAVRRDAAPEARTACLSCAESAPGTGRARCSTTSTSSCRTARSWRCWARTAPARPPS